MLFMPILRYGRLRLGEMNKENESKALDILPVPRTKEEAKVLIEQWRREYNQVRPHSSLGYRPPAPEAILSAVMT